MSVEYRDADPRDPYDSKFVIDGWISSYRTAHAAGLVLMKDWHTVMWSQVEQLIARPYVRTVLAVDARDHDHFYGFLTYEPDARPPYVYYAYTKASHRQAAGWLFDVGVATGLFAHAGIDPRRTFAYACKTPMVARLLLADKIPCAKWDPLPARFERETTTESRST